jgi:hypothetical protein
MTSGLVGSVPYKFIYPRFLVKWSVLVDEQSVTCSINQHIYWQLASQEDSDNDVRGLHDLASSFECTVWQLLVS